MSEKLEGEKLVGRIKDELCSLRADIARGVYTDIWEVSTLLGLEDRISVHSQFWDDEKVAEEVMGPDFCIMSLKDGKIRIDKTRYGWDFFVAKAVERIGKDEVTRILLELEET